VSDLTRVDVDASPDPIQWAELRQAPDLQGALWGLYYSIYYGSVEQITALPDPVLKAYGRVQGALGV
jgi:hypothetical protein